MRELLVLTFLIFYTVNGLADQLISPDSNVREARSISSGEDVHNLDAWRKEVKTGRIVPFSFNVGHQSIQLQLVGAKDYPGKNGWKKTIVTYKEKNHPLTVELTCEFPGAMDMVRTTLTLRTSGYIDGNIRNIQILDLSIPKHEATIHGQTGGISAVNSNDTPPVGSLPWIKPVTETSLEVDAGKDGNSSDEQLPVWLYAENDGGFWYGPEWSGCWHMTVKAAANWNLLLVGLPTFDFRMKENEVITLPSAAFGPYSGSPDDGFNQLRRCIYKFYLPTVNGKKPQPFVYWQGYGGHPKYATEEELYHEVDRAAQAGCEVFCLDGAWNMLPGEFWFKGVGRWDDQRRFPKGVKTFGEYVKSKGMKFGIWIEPRAFKGTPMRDKNPELFYPGEEGVIR